MSQKNDAQSRYVPDRIKTLVRSTEQLYATQEQLVGLQNDIVLDIIDGWSSGDRVQDFMLVACNGVFDKEVYFEQYKYLATLPYRKPHERILVVQEADYFVDEELYFVLRNLYAATLRYADVEWDVDKVLVRIPVEPRYVCCRYIYNQGHVSCYTSGINNEWLEVGPPQNDYCDFGNATVTDTGVAMAPLSGAAAIYIPPWNQKQLFNYHGLEPDDFRRLLNISIRLRNR